MKNHRFGWCAAGTCKLCDWKEAAFMRRIYIAKKGTWFDAGTAVKPIAPFVLDGDYASDFGLFEGLRDGKLDQESCTLDEFDIR